jgi:predicted phosphodiesterase
MNPSREVALKLLREFPNAATKTLARKAYAEFPELWNSLDTCRGMFRRLRGASGVRDRSKSSVKEFFREPQKPGDPFEKLPEPLQTVEQWKPVQIDGPLKVGVICDPHIPYHNTVALRTALNCCRDRGADVLLFNGDLADFFAVSFWEKDPRNRNFKAERDAVVEFLGIARNAFPKARIVWKLGNHEERFARYMQLKAPELLDLAEFSFEHVFKLSEFGVELVKDRNPIAIGALWAIHGHEYKVAIQNPVSPARGLYLRAKVSCVTGHFHQTSQHSEPDLTDKVTSTWGVGCLCDLHPGYMPLNKWNHGFAFVEVDKDGAFQVDNLRIVGGKAWH